MPECVACLDTWAQKPLRHMKCDTHHYCEDCFCQAIELAIRAETYHPVPCGSETCPSLGFEDVRAILQRFTSITTTRRDDLLQQYADKLVEYSVPQEDRIYCQNTACVATIGHSRFLDPNTCGLGDGLHLRCPDCNSVTCISCRGLLDGSGVDNHRCTQQAQDAANYVASLPDHQRWLWQQCRGCNVWVSKDGEGSCNHMTCWYGRLSRHSHYLASYSSPDCQSLTGAIINSA